MASLDTIGIAGFSHDFGTLHGEKPEVLAIFESFSSLKPSMMSIIAFILLPVFPFLAYIPTTVRRLTNRLNKAMGTIATALLRSSKEIGDKSEDKSAMGLLCAYHLVKLSLFIN